MAEAHPYQQLSRFLMHCMLLCVLKLAYSLYLLYIYVMFDFSANAVPKCDSLGVQGGKTGTQVPHGVQNDKCECSAGAVARLTSYLFRSDVLPRAQLSIDTHRSVQDKNRG